MHYTIFNPDSGQILTTGIAPTEQDCRDQTDLYPGSEMVHVNLDGDLVYLPGRTATSRPTLDALELYEIAADGVAEVSFALPDQTLIHYDRQTFTTDGSAFSFTTDIPGEYLFEVEPPFPCRRKKVTIHAV